MIRTGEWAPVEQFIMIFCLLLIGSQVLRGSFYGLLFLVARSEPERDRIVEKSGVSGVIACIVWAAAVLLVAALIVGNGLVWLLSKTPFGD